MSLKRTIFDVKNATVLHSSGAMFRQLMRDQFLDPDDLERLQAERAIRHARFAMQHTRFYRDRYTAAGFTLADLDDPAAFSELPIIEKSEVRNDPAAFRSSEATDRNSKATVTGGSTGEPLRLLRDLRTPTRAIEWRMWDWWGIHPADDIAIIVRHVRSADEDRLHNLQWWPSKRFQLDAHHISDASVAEFVELWRAVKPALLMGYVGGVADVSRRVRSLAVNVPPPRAVGVTAAPLTPALRLTIEEAFHSPVYDTYRSAEVPWMAGECAAHDGLHTFADVRKVEVVNDAGRQVIAGELGQTVVTDLTNRVFPIIRYRIGDVTTPIDGLCSCGVTLPRIRPVSGRVSDAMRLPDGQSVAGEALTMAFSITPEAVRQFQIHQQSDYSIVIRCVPGDGANAKEEIDLAVDRFRNLMDHRVPVSLEIVEQIAHDGGKIRYIKSDVV
ncbi:MAG: hypothetical protein ABI053_09140 [Lacisediminihabitans sp.]